MYSTNLRKVGGSVMLTVPPAILDILHLQIGTTVGMAIEGERLIVEARNRPKYTLEELLAQCDETIEITTEEQEWMDMKPVGTELL